MSSTSSSDCDNCDCSQCTYLLGDNHDNYNYIYYGKAMKSSRHVPVYSTMAHPLIYYAEIQRRQPLDRRQTSDQPTKENRNYFVKAFKWYTQERLPSNKNDKVPESSGFASWLDNKYIEYKREGRQRQCYELQAQDTATIEPYAPCLSSYEPCTTKKFARFKSPWRKRRRPCNDSGDVPDKCTKQSCEFILQPKDLTRAASDNCYHTPTSGGIKSNATVASSNMQGNWRWSGRSHSLSSICCEKSVPKHIDTIPHTVKESQKPQEPTKPSTPCCPCHREKTSQIVQVPSKSRAVDVSCQCPEEKVIPVNVETQYEPIKHETPSNTQNLVSCYCIVDTGYKPMAMPMQTPVKKQSKKISNPEINNQKKLIQSSVSCQCPEENIDRVNSQQTQYQPDPCKCHHVSAPVSRDTHEINQVFGPKPIRHQSYSTVALNEKTCEGIVKEVAIVNKFTYSLTYFANDAVQTSDHAISFENGEACPYPLYLKIVCADRLNKECF